MWFTAKRVCAGMINVCMMVGPHNYAEKRTIPHQEVNILKTNSVENAAFVGCGLV